MVKLNFTETFEIFEGSLFKKLKIYNIWICKYILFVLFQFYIFPLRILLLYIIQLMAKEICFVCVFYFVLSWIINTHEISSNVEEEYSKQ